MTCFTAQKNLLRPRFFEAAFRSFFKKMGVFGQALDTYALKGREYRGCKHRAEHYGLTPVKLLFLGSKESGQQRNLG